MFIKCCEKDNPHILNTAHVECFSVYGDKKVVAWHPVHGDVNLLVKACDTHEEALELLSKLFKAMEEERPIFDVFED